MSSIPYLIKKNQKMFLMIFGEQRSEGSQKDAKTEMLDFGPCGRRPLVRYASA